MTLLKKLKAKTKPKKIKKARYNVIDGECLIEGDDALLLAEACKLDKQQKAIKKKFDKVKKQLAFTVKGEYTNKAGDKVVVSVTPKKSDIDPKELYDHMVEKGLTKRFWGVVKAQITPLKQVIPQSEIDDFQHVLDDVVKCTFK